MRYLFFYILFISTVFSSTSKVILSSNLNGKIISISETKEEFSYTADGISEVIPKKKCSEKNLKQFYSNLHEQSKKSLSLKSGNVVQVTIWGKKKKVGLNSPLGNYLQNIVQHLLTLKKESAIACKK
ncbi:MAG: hypothetical protein AB7I27_12715 [Bacteriovoracaceae bacterium]